MDGHCEVRVKRERWEGGYIHRQSDGRELFIIERQVGGRRYHVSTRAHSRRAAIKQLEKFEADPAGYERAMREGRSAEDQGVYMTADLVLEFRDWMLNRERPATPKWANELAHRLTDWIEDLGTRDLRSLELRELKEMVERRGVGKQHRIIAIKVFFGWLRTVKFLVQRREDATLDLAVPQASPEKHRRRKAVPAASVRGVLAQLAEPYRDCLLLLAHTGWHVTELERFAREPDAQIAAGRGKVLGVLQVRHKIGHTTRTPVWNQEVLDAAKRIREREGVPRRMNKALREACGKAGVEEFTFGVLRHSVATWAIEAGTSPEVVAEFLGHQSKTTTLKFYADVAVPTPKVKLPRL